MVSEILISFEMWVLAVALVSSGIWTYPSISIISFKANNKSRALENQTQRYLFQDHITRGNTIGQL